MDAQVAASSSLDSHDDYQPMLDAVRATFGNVKGPLFTTDATDLWKTWLGGLPVEEQQHHNCHACRRFVERYGGLVTIDADGHARPAMFSEAPGIYRGAFAAVERALASAKVTGVFVSSDKIWGTAQNTDRKRDRTWRHMCVTPRIELVHPVTRALNAGQRAAELHEDYATLCRALAELKTETLATALRIAESQALYRGEKVEGRIRWLVDLHAQRGAAKGRVRDHLTWFAVATAPAGFCHVRSSIVGSLLEDIEAGKSFDDVKRAFDAKMHPLQYQRPTAPPSEGNIAQAEAIVEKLGIAPSLRRRFARLEDLQTMWTPKPSLPLGQKSGGVFAHLRDEVTPSAMIVKAPALSWEKFVRTALGDAEEISALVPNLGAFYAFVTAADADAPPIIQWDRAEARNPVTWYVYHGGSTATQWNLVPGWTKVTAISRFPHRWQPGHEHHGDGALVAIDGCRDGNNASSCLFPEQLKSDLHAVRSTIEAFSRRDKLEEPERASACGLAIRQGETKPMGVVQLRVTTRGAVTEYTIDRWD